LSELDDKAILISPKFAKLRGRACSKYHRLTVERLAIEGAFRGKIWQGL